MPQLISDFLLIDSVFREGVMEFLLMNHPLDCPICDQGGECDLQVVNRCICVKKMSRDM